MDGTEEKNRIIILTIAIFSVSFLGIKIERIPILGIEFGGNIGSGVILILSFLLIWLVVRAGFRFFESSIDESIRFQNEIIASSDQDLTEILGQEADLAVAKDAATTRLEKLSDIRNRYIKPLRVLGWLLLLLLSFSVVFISLAWTSKDWSSMINSSLNRCNEARRPEMITETFKFKSKAGKLIDAFRRKNPDGSLGGVVAVSAKVHPTAIICYDAWVEPNARVSANTFVADGQIVRESDSPKPN